MNNGRKSLKENVMYSEVRAQAIFDEIEKIALSSRAARALLGAGVGGGVGAGAGALSDSKHRGRNALIGAGLGAATGGGVGALLGRAAKAHTPALLPGRTPYILEAHITRPHKPINLGHGSGRMTRSMTGPHRPIIPGAGSKKVTRGLLDRTHH